MQLRQVLYNCDPGVLPAGDAIRVLVGLRVSICAVFQRILFWGIDRECSLVGFAAESWKHRVFAVLPWASRVHLASAAPRDAASSYRRRVVLPRPLWPSSIVRSGHGGVLRYGCTHTCIDDVCLQLFHGCGPLESGSRNKQRTQDLSMVVRSVC